MLLQPGSKPMKFKRIVSDLTNTVNVQVNTQGKAEVNGVALTLNQPGILLSVYKCTEIADSGMPAGGRIPPYSNTTITIDGETLSIPQNVYAQSAVWYSQTAYNYSDIQFGPYNDSTNFSAYGGYLTYMKKQIYASQNPVTYRYGPFPSYFWDTTANTSGNNRLNIPFNTITISHAASSTYVGSPSSTNTLSVRSYLVIEYAVSE